MEWRHPSIIALKGYPFTGKSTLAFELAEPLCFCQVLSLDEILDSITPGAYSSDPESDQQLVDQAFDILCGLVEKQMSIGQSVIIDSLPLSRPHLDRLVRLSESSNATKLIIVECRISREYAWKMRFEEKKYPKDIVGDAGSIAAWYKARDWERDVERLVKGYDKRLDEPIPGVSRLLLNRDDEHNHGYFIILAIQALVFCQDDRHVDYQKWNDYHQGIHIQKNVNCACPQHICKDKGHRITIFMGEGLVDGYENEAGCGVCESPVLGPAYSCNTCHLVLHKSCAEMQSAQNGSFTPQEFPTFLRKSSMTSAADHNEPYVFSFPKNFPCLRCREEGQEFSDQCAGCIFESHLKCGLVPTVIEHQGHEHMLTFWASEVSGRARYKCGACGKEGAYAAYMCTRGCKNHGWYHVECALLPHLVQSHDHGGHHHPLQLMVKREDTDQDDFPCDSCLENMSPEDWYYYCAECPQTYHLYCAFAQDA